MISNKDKDQLLIIHRYLYCKEVHLSNRVIDCENFCRKYGFSTDSLNALIQAKREHDFFKKILDELRGQLDYFSKL